MDSPRLDRALRFKNNSARGGVIERVAMRDVTVGEVAEAVVAADFFYEEGKNGAFTPMLRDVDVRNVTSRKSQLRVPAARLRASRRSPTSASPTARSTASRSRTSWNTCAMSCSPTSASTAYRRDARITR